jgi:hypothetical protein
VVVSPGVALKLTKALRGMPEVTADQKYYCHAPVTRLKIASTIIIRFHQRRGPEEASLGKWLIHLIFGVEQLRAIKLTLVQDEPATSNPYRLLPHCFRNCATVYSRWYTQRGLLNRSDALASSARREWCSTQVPNLIAERSNH